MRLRIIAFSKQGMELEKRISSIIKDQIDASFYYKLDIDNDDNNLIYVDDVKQWVLDGFTQKEGIIFIGAMGIAVRMIAPFVNDKFSDSPVLVMDDGGAFIIPVLSGHVGGANRIAEILSDKLNVFPIITTSTDVNDAFSVDTFAIDKNLRIINRDRIKKVSSKAIEGKPVILSIKDYPYENADVLITDDSLDELLMKDKKPLILKTKRYVVGIGLKKDKDYESVEELVLKVLGENAIDINEVYAFASIDVKIEEEALKKLSSKYRIPLLFFDAKVLNKAKGEFTSSSFVLDTVGVDNVCERAAAIASGSKGRIVVNKVCGNGVTVAVAMM